MLDEGHHGVGVCVRRAAVHSGKLLCHVIERRAQDLQDLRLRWVARPRQLVGLSVGFFSTQRLLDVAIPERHVTQLIRERTDGRHRVSIVSIFRKLLGELDHLVADL